jgi:hypothetical protein
MSQLPEDPMSQIEIDEIKALYREAAGEQPSIAHDAAVLAAMQTELATARRAKARPLRKWQLPVALAATVVLTVAITMTVERERPSEDYPPIPGAPGPAAPAEIAPYLPQQGAKSPPSENARGLAQPSIDAGKPAASAVEERQVQKKAFIPPAAPPELLPEPRAPSPSALPSNAGAATSPALGKEQSVPVPAAQIAPSINDTRARSQLFESGVRRDSADKAQPANGADAAASPSTRVQSAPLLRSRDSLDAAKQTSPAPPVGYESKPIVSPAPPPPPAPKPEVAPPAFAAPPASAPAVAPPEAFPRIESRQRANIAAPVRPPHEWLDVIRGLKQAGKNMEAEAELKKFRLAYPDYPTPADLLQPAQPKP